VARLLYASTPGGASARQDWYGAGRHRGWPALGTRTFATEPFTFMFRQKPRSLISLTLTLPLAMALGCTKAPPKARKVASDELKDVDTKQVKGAAGQAKGPAAELGSIPKGPVARVGEVDVGREAFMAIYDLKLQKYRDRDRPIPRSADRRYRQHITQRLIYQEALRQECEKLGVDYDREALKTRYATQRKGLRDWEKHLRKRGESDASLKEQLVAELRERAILKHKGTLDVTDDDVKVEYDRVAKNYDRDSERVRAAHILFSALGRGPRPGPAGTPEALAALAKGEAEAMARAEEVYKKLAVPGADFAAMAREFSDGPSAPKGGDLGIFSKERMVPEFSKAAFALKPGGVSKPVKSKFGVHIIKISGRYGPGPLPMEALADQLRSRLLNQKVHKGRRELKRSLLATYAIDDLMEKSLPPTPVRKRKEFPKRKDAAIAGTGLGTPPSGAVRLAPPGAATAAAPKTSQANNGGVAKPAAAPAAVAAPTNTAQ